ncbi:MAG: PIN domain-containing protein [Acidobacteria bacterium]|nr:PIN domain-containing protein [Acidobacteriota bacterium]
MILVDANVLIYAIDADGLVWIVILAFLRLTTREGILKKPLSPERAMAFVDEWLAQPYVRAVGPGDGHWTILRKLLRDAGTAGNLTSDAHVAAVALELGASICSTDADFGRYPGVERISPLG